MAVRSRETESTLEMHEKSRRARLPAPPARKGKRERYL
jgi:hypothetical protein